MSEYIRIEKLHERISEYIRITNLKEEKNV